MNARPTPTDDASSANLESPTESARALVSVADIAEMAGAKSRATVSNWRKRHADFPTPVDDNPSRPLFDREEIVTWLTGRGYKVADNHGAALWASMNAVRGYVDAAQLPGLLLTLATLKKLSSEQEVNLPPWYGFHPSDGLGGLQRVLDGMSDEEERFTTLFNLDASLCAIPAEVVESAYNEIANIPDEDLASAVDFALARVAKSQGRKGEGLESGFAESRTSQLLASLALGHRGAIYDPACGVAEALTRALTAGFEATDIRGDEINAATAVMARQRLYLRGYDATIANVDVLGIDAHPGWAADVIVAEPPFGGPLPNSFVLSDPRWRYGLPPRSSSESAWLQHTVEHLAADGRGYVLTTPTALTRRDPARLELVRAGCVEAIVALPPRMLPHTSIPLALWVLRPPQASDQTVTLIDTSTDLESDTQVAGWLNALRAGQTPDVAHRRVDIEEIVVADGDLSPMRWVNAVERTPEDVTRVYDHTWRLVQDRLKDVGAVGGDLVKIDPVLTSRTLTIRELIDQGIVAVSSRRGRDRDVPEELADLLIKPGTILSGAADSLEAGDADAQLDLVPLPNNVPADWRKQLTEPGEVLLCNRVRVYAVCDTLGGHIPAPDVYRLRVTNPDQLDPRFLAAALRGSWNHRFLAGTAVPQANIHLLEVPMVAPDQQALVVQASITAAALDRQAKALQAEAAALRQALLDTVRYTGDDR